MILDDSQGLFSPADYTTLETEAARWPFEVHVITRTAASRAELVRAVHDGVTGPHVVCIGLDATHRYVEVHFGTAVGVTPGQFGELAASGRSAFKQGHWREGVETIADRTAQVTTQAHAAAPAIGEPSSSQGHGVLIFLIAVVPIALTMLGFYLWNRKRWGALEEERAQLRARNAEEEDWHERMRASVPPYRTPAAPPPRPMPVGPTGGVPYGDAGYRAIALPLPLPVYVAPPAPNNDALLAYELGRLDGDRERPVVQERVVERVVEVDRSDDAGGAGAAWSGSTDTVDAGGAGDSFADATDTGSSDLGGAGGDF